MQNKRPGGIGGLLLAVALTLVAVVLAHAAPRVDPEESTATPASHGMTNWKAVASSGMVEARPSNVNEEIWSRVRRGDELSPRTALRTGRRGRATLTRDAAIMIVDPKSVVELPEQGPSGLESSVIQTEGSVLYEVDGREYPHFEVVTPYLVAGVKGTSFLVTVNDRYTSITVDKGLVEVRSPRTGERQEVRPGESLFHDNNDDTSELVNFHERNEVHAVRAEAHRMAEMSLRETRRIATDLRPDRGDTDDLADHRVKDVEPGNATVGALNEGQDRPEETGVVAADVAGAVVRGEDSSRRENDGGIRVDDDGRVRIDDTGHDRDDDDDSQSHDDDSQSHDDGRVGIDQPQERDGDRNDAD